MRLFRFKNSINHVYNKYNCQSTDESQKDFLWYLDFLKVEQEAEHWFQIFILYTDDAPLEGECNKQ